MRSNNRRGILNRNLWVLSGAFLVAISGTALGQSSEKDPLKGPAVKDGGAPGTNRKFTTKKGMEKGSAERELPMRSLAQALNVLKGEQAAESVRITADQQKQIETITKEFRESVESFRSENGAEIRELISQLPPQERRVATARVQTVLGGPIARQEGGRPGGQAEKGQKPKADAPMDDDSMTPAKAPASNGDSEAAKARIKSIMETAPKAADAQTKVWGVLTGEQKTLVEQEIARMKSQREKERAEKNAEGEGKDAMSPEGAEKGRRQMTPEMREKLKNMSPEERREAMEKYRDKRRTEDGAGKGKKGKPANGEKARPNMDDVNVPSPDDN